MTGTTRPAQDAIARYGFLVAGALFVLAYGVVLGDRAARTDMLPWGVTTVVALGAVAWDERRLSQEARAQAFPASGALDIVAFLQFAVALHFLRTRWSAGWFRAVASAAAATVLVTLPELLLGPIEPAESALDLALGVALAGALAGALPLPVLLVWRFFGALEATFDVERVAVGLGIGLLAASTVACLAALAFV